MKCAHCLEEIADGASVCRHCGRNQPLPPAKRNRREIFVAMAVFGAIGLLGLFFYVQREMQVRHCVRRTVLSAAFADNKISDAAVESTCRALIDLGNDD